MISSGGWPRASRLSPRPTRSSCRRPRQNDSRCRRWQRRRTSIPSSPGFVARPALAPSATSRWPTAPAVLPSLNALVRLHTQAAVAAQAAASSAGGQALAIAVAAIILAIAAGVAFSIFAVRLVGRGLGREQDLQAALERLGDRDELLGRLRSASGVLGEVTGELRMAAKNAEAVTSGQASAVAETSATIEELATTAGSIAENVHAVAKAAERSGDTMRDMQEKVEAIAARPPSLRR